MTKKLEPATYWQWSNAISQLWNKEKALEVERLKADILQKDIDNMILKLALIKATHIKYAVVELNEAKNEYQRLKSKIETELETSLNDKYIDEVTFEIRGFDEFKDKGE